MATYKVPQDVEADDKLLGPFTFRQFVYLMVVFGLGMMAFGLFQIFPLLAIIPVPFMLFFGILALPIKKDQPIETYLAALVSFYTKPKKRYWIPGQSDSTIQIIAPKKPEPIRVRNITEDEASHRLSFLAELVDSEGHAIKNANTAMKDDFYAEAMGTADMFEQASAESHAAGVAQMRAAISASEPADGNIPSTAPSSPLSSGHVIQPRPGFTNPDTDTPAPGTPQPTITSPTIVQPDHSGTADEVFISLH